MSSRFEAELNERVADLAYQLAELARAAAQEMVERALETNSVAPAHGGSSRLPTTAHQAQSDPFAQLFEQLRKRTPLQLTRACQEFERIYIERMLEKSDGIITHSAKLLGVSRQSLQRKMQRLGLQRRQ